MTDLHGQTRQLAVRLFGPSTAFDVGADAVFSPPGFDVVVRLGAQPYAAETPKGRKAQVLFVFDGDGDGGYAADVDAHRWRANVTATTSRTLLDCASWIAAAGRAAGIGVEPGPEEYDKRHHTMTIGIVPGGGV